MFSPRLSAWRRLAQSRPLHSARLAERGGQEQQSVRAGREASVSSACALSVALSAWSSSKGRNYLRVSRMPAGTVCAGGCHIRRIMSGGSTPDPNHQDPVACRAHERHGDDTPDERPRDDDCDLHFFECHDRHCSDARRLALSRNAHVSAAQAGGVRAARRRCRSAFRRRARLKGSVIRVVRTRGGFRRSLATPLLRNQEFTLHPLEALRLRIAVVSRLSASIADAFGDCLIRSAPKASRHQGRHERQGEHNDPVRN